MVSQLGRQPDTMAGASEVGSGQSPFIWPNQILYFECKSSILDARSPEIYLPFLRVPFVAQRQQLYLPLVQIRTMCDAKIKPKKLDRSKLSTALFHPVLAACRDSHYRRLSVTAVACGELGSGSGEAHAVFQQNSKLAIGCY